MTEFTYKGYCPKCKKYSTFWGGSVTAVICDDCDTTIKNPYKNIKECSCIGMYYTYDETY